MTEQTPERITYQPDEIEAMLALVATGEVGPENMSPALDLSRLTAREIVSAVRVVNDASHRVRQEERGEPVHVSDIDRRLERYDRDIQLVFEEMPTYIGVEKTRDVFTILASSESVDDRIYVAHCMGTLTVVDHDYGVDLWKRLLEDDVADVARSAWYVASLWTLDSGYAKGALGSEKALAADGLTWRDFVDFTRIYIGRLETLRDGRDSVGEIGL